MPRIAPDFIARTSAFGESPEDLVAWANGRLQRIPYDLALAPQIKTYHEKVDGEWVGPQIFDDNDVKALERDLGATIGYSSEGFMIHGQSKNGTEVKPLSATTS